MIADTMKICRNDNEQRTEYNEGDENRGIEIDENDEPDSEDEGWVKPYEESNAEKEKKTEAKPENRE